MKAKAVTLGVVFTLAAVAFAGTTTDSRVLRDGRVSVAFIHPEGFTDAGPRWSDREREGILRDLGAAMQRMAAQYLRDDVSIEINVRDLDLAGEIEDWRGMQFRDVRVMRDVYPPRMTIDYRLRDGQGHSLAQGEAKLSDRDFLFGVHPDLDRLRFDKALFRDWFRGRFSEFRKVPGGGVAEGNLRVAKK